MQKQNASQLEKKKNPEYCYTTLYKLYLHNGVLPIESVTISVPSFHSGSDPVTSITVRNVKFPTASPKTPPKTQQTNN